MKSKTFQRRRHPAAGIRIRTAGVQSGPGVHLNAVTRLKMAAVKIRGYLKGRRGKITDQHPHGFPAVFGKFSFELKAVPAHRSGFCHGKLSGMSTEFR